MCVCACACVCAGMYASVCPSRPLPNVGRGVCVGGGGGGGGDSFVINIATLSTAWRYSPFTGCCEAAGETGCIGLCGRRQRCVARRRAQQNLAEYNAIDSTRLQTFVLMHIYVRVTLQMTREVF